MSAQQVPIDSAGRGPPPAWRPRPLTWRLILRVLGVGAGVAAFLSLFGPFDRPLAQVAAQDLEYLLYSWTGSMLGLSGVRLCWRIGLWRRGPIVVGIATGVIMAGPMILAVWAIQLVMVCPPPPAAALPNIIWDVLLICLGASLLAILVSGRGGRMAEATAPPKFLDRLPLRLRGAELWAVEAEDHYLRLHTSQGQDLILMRLADAIDELEGIEGAQVHRSWWVARQAIADARRGDGRATLTLRDGSEVPVSRTYARQLRERKWI